MDLLKSFFNNGIIEIDNKMIPTSGLSYMDDLVVFISLVIIFFLIFIYFIMCFIQIFRQGNLLESSSKRFFLPFIGFILICMANYKIWNYKSSSLYPEVKKIFSRDLPLPVIIYFMLCMTQTIISYMVAVNDNNYNNWANFYIKYFVTILCTYLLFLLVRNGYTTLVWIIAFLPMVLLYFLVTYILTMTLLNPNTKELSRYIDKNKRSIFSFFNIK